MGMVGMATVAAGLIAGNPAEGRTVLVCLNPGGNAAVVGRAQAGADRIFRQIGLRLRWQPDVRRCGNGIGIAIALAENTPVSSHPGALAYALPFAGARAVVFFDRVRAAAPPERMPALLAHVLAHEIVHILQGVDRHSEAGLMKPRWEHADHVEMGRRPLPIAPDDVLLIERGLHVRATSK